MRRLAWVAVSVVAALGSPAAASGAITSSTVTAPATGTQLFYNGDIRSGSVTVRGTASGSLAGAKGDLLCYYDADTKLRTLSTGINVSSGSFAGSFSLAPVAGLACRLAVVPAGATPTGSHAAHFSGPTIVVNDQFSRSSHGSLYSYEILAGNLRWAFDLDSVGECSVAASYATDPVSLGSFTLFAGNGCLPHASSLTSQKRTRSALQVDGADAYPPGAIPGLSAEAGFEPLSYSAAFDAAHDAVTVAETDAVMACDPPATWPPTTTTCPSLHDSGIQIRQTAEILPSGEVTRVSDRFQSIDGRAHQIDALFMQSIEGPSPGTIPAFQFPGDTSFAAHAFPDAVSSFPAGAGSIFVVGDPSSVTGIPNPIGAITYGQPPLSVNFLSGEGTQTATFVMHYAATVPAGSFVQYDFSYSQAATSLGLFPVEAVERDRFSTPALTISRPRLGLITRRHVITVKGLATDAVNVRSVTVSGHSASLSAGGAFTAQVKLRPGTNVIVAVARNLAGNATTASVSVVYEPLPCVVPKLRGRSLPAARRVLARSDCRVGRIRHARSKKVRRNHVIGTRPGPGKQRSPNAKVELLVSRGA